MTFEEHSRLPYPKPDTPIWRYIGYPKFNWILQTRQLHFHQAADQKDPYEGGIPKAVEEKYKEADDTGWSFDEYKEVAEYSRELTYLNCWHINDGESAGMWDLYGRSGRSIAIESTVGKMNEALDTATDYPIGAGHVRYADYNSSWEDLDQYSKEAINEVAFHDGINFKDLFHLKRDSFRHEREFRAYVFFTHYFREEIYEMDQLRDYELPFGINHSDKYSIYTAVPDGTGFNVQVDVDKLIEKIHIAPDSPSWVVDSIKATLANSYDLELSFADVKSSELYDDPWDGG
ncbi:DUF2971 domain-containing protein [Haloarcula litorea]|uniref:DUF2971 domain-containing protein n=1 Tax=Haloarcula litorea TaxID=3032579 RepID=UPI0023E79D24|nr:DUF2971 domain-containing protein [Halomicroarcula sp. GDY20]